MDMPVEAANNQGSHHHFHIPRPLATIRPATMVTLPVPSRRQVVNPVRPGREQRQQRTRVPGCGWSGRLHLPPERCPSGLRSTPGKCVWVNSSSRVRPEPPPGGDRTRRRRSRRAAPKGVSRRRRRIIPPSPPLPHGVLRQDVLIFRLGYRCRREFALPKVANALLHGHCRAPNLPVSSSRVQTIACHIPRVLATIRSATKVTPPVPSRRQVVNSVNPARE